jgi:hypothetical protein
MYEGGQKGRAWDEADPYAFLGRRPGMAVSYCAVFPFVTLFSLQTGNSLGRLWEHASEQTSERAEQHSLSFYMYFLFSSLLFSFVDTIPLLYTYIY